MKAFKNHQGKIATLDKANVDTDQIIAKQFLKKITRTGFGEHLFHDWRYLPDGRPNPDFELNQERFKNATVLVARNNFGCGSSREHAVWAIEQYGFHVVIAPSVQQIPGFADIFRNNSLKNGLLTIELKEAEVEDIFQMVDRFPGLEAKIDLEHQSVSLVLPEAISFHFEIDSAIKHRLIHGLDDIGISLQHAADISAFEKNHNAQWFASKK
jgi:3-isopropylmalate/(R)-2-methylmalate dehydratase small subunit